MMNAMADSDEAALASLGIQVQRTPFDWGDTPKHYLPYKKGSVDQMQYTAPSGLDSLKQFVTKNNPDDVHQKSKDLLRNLLDSHNVHVSVDPSSSSRNKSAESRYNQLLLPDTDTVVASRDVSIRGLSDRAVAELTCDSRTSLFGSILRLFDMDRGDSGGSDEKKTNQQKQQQQQSQQKQQQQQKDPMIRDAPILSTAEIVRSVHLTASPGDIPAGMDSKEYTQAALHFLSTHVNIISENESDYRKKDDESSKEGWDMLRRTLPILPLIKAINPQESLEKRSYGRVRPLVTIGKSERKQYPDSVDLDMEFRRKVLNLERVFTSSLPFPMKEFEPFAFQKYMPRRKLVPRIEGGGAKEELTLMISGHMQQSHNTPGPKAKAASTASAQASMTSPAASSDTNSTVNAPSTGAAQSDVKPSSDELNTYMDKWVATHAPINLMPSLKQKETIIEETGVDKKRLESWFYRARKKMKRNQAEVAPSPAPPITKAYSDLLNAATQVLAPSTTTMETDDTASSTMPQGNVTHFNIETKGDGTFKA